MSWLDSKENEKFYRDLADQFLEADKQANEAGREKRKAEKALLDAMIDAEIDEIQWSGRSIRVEWPEEGKEGEVYLSADFMHVLDLHK